MMTHFKKRIGALFRTAVFTAGALLLPGISVNAQDLFVNDIRLDWDPGASTHIDEETQIIEFRPGDPITYTVTYGRTNREQPPQERQPFRVIIFLSPDGDARLEGDSLTPQNLDNYELDWFTSYGPGTFNDYADAQGLPEDSSVRLEEAGATQQPLPSFFRSRTYTAMLPRNYTGTFFLTAVIQVHPSGAGDPDLTDNTAVLTTAKVRIQSADSATVERVSSSATGGDADEMSEAPSVSRDGRYVVYHSEASNIVPGFDYPTRVAQVYLRDNLTETTTLISQRGGIPGNQESRYPVISADGRYIAFQSTATNLVTNDRNQQTDVFLYQIATGVTTRISNPNAGGEANRGNFLPSISADGWTVAFESDSTNLVSSPFPDTNGLRDVYVYRRAGDPIETGADVAGQVFPASIRHDGVFGNGASDQASVSLDGNSVAFRSFSDNLQTPRSGKAFEPVTRRSPDGRRYSEIYVKELGYVQELITGNNLSDEYGYVVRASFKRTMDYANGFELNRDSYDPAISADGRYVAFASRASNVQPDQNHVNSGNVSQVYLLNRQVDLARPMDEDGNTSLSLITEGPDRGFGQQDALEPVISENGQVVGYRTEAGNLQPENVRRSDGVIFNTFYQSAWERPQDWNALTSQEREDIYERATFGRQEIAGFSDTNGRSDIYVRDTGIVSIRVDNGGSGYSTSNPPLVNIVGGGGSGAQAVAIVEDGRVARIDITSPGSGYTLPHDLLTEHPLYDDRLQVHIVGDASATALLTDGNERVTVSKFGKQTTGIIGDFSVPSSRNLALSADGRYMAFASDANNRGSFIFGKSDWRPLDHNQTRDVFLVDRRVGAVLSPEQGILPIVQVEMDNHPATFNSNRIIRVTAFDGGSNDPNDPRGRIVSLRLFANDIEFSNVTRAGINSERAVARTSWTVPAVAGAFQIYAVAEDIDGNRVLSTPVNVQVSPPFSLPPLVNVTVTPSTITLGEEVTIRAFPSDPDNGVSFVRYFSNGTQIGLTDSEPHEIAYTPSEAQNYEIVAVVADGPPPEELPPPPALRNTRMSSTQILRVIPLPSPQVDITRPEAGADLAATVGQPMFFELQALTSNPLTTISAVALKIDGHREIPATRLGLSSTYRVEWRPRVTEVGSIQVRALAVDSMGAEGESDPVTVEVRPAPTTNPPAVAVDEMSRTQTVGIPPNEQIELVPVDAEDNLFTHQKLIVSILAGQEVEDPPGTFTVVPDPGRFASVDLYASGGFVSRATAPNPETNAFDIEVDLSRLGQGEHDLVAIARDHDNNFVGSAPVTITVMTPPPAITLLEPQVDPATGEAVAQTGDSVRLLIDARSPDPLITITDVAVTASDETIGRATRIAGTNTYVFNWQPTSTGLVEIGVNATDSTGATRISPTTTIRVTESITPRPTVFIISPEVEDSDLDNAFLLTDRSEWPFAAVAVGGQRPITRVEFFYLQVTPPEDADAPLPTGGISMGLAQKEPALDAWRLDFNLAGTPPGLYVVTAVAEDDLGRRGVSAPVPVLVVRGIGPGLPRPKLTVTPSRLVVNEDVVTIKVQAPATEGRVEEVRLLMNGFTAVFDDFDNPMVREGLEATPFEWIFNWVDAGSYNVIAVARDTLGNTRISNVVPVVALPETGVGNPADPQEPDSFVAQLYLDLFADRLSPTIEELEFLSDQLASGEKTRGEIIADLVKAPQFNNVRWVVAAYLTVLQEAPTPEELREGLDILGEDEIDITLPPHIAPFELDFVIQEILESFQFRIKFGAPSGTGDLRPGENGMTTTADRLVRIVHQDRGTARTKAEREADMESFGRLFYLTELTQSRLAKSEIQRQVMKAALTVLLLDRKPSREEISNIPMNFNGLNGVAAAAEFIVSRPEYAQRFAAFFETGVPVPSFGPLAETDSIVGSLDTGSGLFVKESWFGKFSDLHFNYLKGSGWLQHAEHGWIYIAEDRGHPNSVWYWEHIQKDWLWTRHDLYPRLYSDGDDRWLFYREGGSPRKREFFIWNRDSGQWTGPVVLPR